MTIPRHTPPDDRRRTAAGTAGLPATGGRASRVVAGLALAALAVAPLALPSSGAAATSTAAAAPQAKVDLASFRGLGDSPLALPDLDQRGTRLPSATQTTAASALAADVRWNDMGTPSSILPTGASLGSAPGGAVAGARAWIKANRALFGMTAAEVDALELVNNQALAQSSARAVLFRQRLGSLTPALGSMVTVGVAGGQVAYVSSSLVRGLGTAPAATLGATGGWLKAAQNAGLSVTAADIGDVRTEEGWTVMSVAGIAQEQRARIRGLAFADGSVRPVVEANVLDVAGARALAYTSLVDAVSGAVVYRENQVEQAVDTDTFEGAITATTCGPVHPVPVADDTTRQIAATATAVVPSNDIVLKILDPDGQLLTSSDTATSPEAATYTADPLPQGTYGVQVCPFDDPTAPFTEPGDYVGTVSLSETAGSAPGVPYPPKWEYFLTNPTPVFTTSNTPTNRVTGCWATQTGGSPVAGCDTPPGALDNLASRSPWDVDPVSSLPTMTTVGNNADTHEAWVSPLTPGGLAQAPVSAQRDYSPAFQDRWNNSRCNPAELVPGGNDIEASVGNLFVAHNRMHDYSYFLGFTEENYNLQKSNLGRGGQGGDPEVGNAQAGAISGGAPSYLGRDNANQITLQDGVPGITNQYLFQPIAGAFYAPCTDGGLDMGIVGHEYTHAISNRMVGGPDEGLTSEQGRAMGESWGDLVAGEYQFSNGYANGGNIWAVGLYATGNKQVAIRDYAIDANPLTYGEYGFDSTGEEVHADGEIWNATMWRVRQALVDRYNATHPYTNASLQRQCASGTGTSSPLPAGQCPGNRRWVQLMFDAFLLQQGATSMLDARDAMLAADQMRFGGVDRAVMWQAFARSGMGVDASTPSADSGDVEPSFATPTGNRSVRVKLQRPDGTAVPGQVFVGTYEARATPVVDTLPGTARDDVAVMRPGSYPVVVQSATTGLTRGTLAVVAGSGTQTATFTLQPNLAALANGASVAASSPGSLNAEYLIDSTEATNWAGVNASGANVDAVSPSVTVDLAGATARSISKVTVSAMLRPADSTGSDPQEDPDSGSRFTALRRFAIEVCASGCGSVTATWTRVFTSPANAFPGVQPRPVAPNLNFRTFTFPAVNAQQVRLVALENQCTGFAGYAGEQDADPLNATDCKTASDRGQSVRAAELEVFER